MYTQHLEPLYNCEYKTKKTSRSMKIMLNQVLVSYKIMVLKPRIIRLNNSAMIVSVKIVLTSHNSLATLE